MSADTFDTTFQQSPPPYPPPLPLQLEIYAGQQSSQENPTKKAPRKKAVRLEVQNALGRLINQATTYKGKIILISQQIRTKLPKATTISSALLINYLYPLAQYFKKAIKPAKRLMTSYKNPVNYLRQASRTPYKVFRIVGVVTVATSIIILPFVSPGIWLPGIFAACLQFIIGHAIRSKTYIHTAPKEKP